MAAQFGLKQLIRAVRACKTAADERMVIQKESAHIRQTFRESNSMDQRYFNMCKLLYIYMLGYPAHFGQIECVKLVASAGFADKRLGYLGIMLLLDENQEILTLVTNSLKNDLCHANQYIVGLALTTLGNIASSEMAHDLVDEVEKLVDASNPYIRKKAALCALRLIKRVPELDDGFVRRSLSLLNEKHHGVLLTGSTLIAELCETNPEMLASMRGMVPVLTRQLRTMLSPGYAAEHSVGGIADPYLQVKLLRLLRVLAANDAATTEAISEILTQIGTSTDSTKNAGMAVLYETATAILAIPSDAALRVLAINILGKFLASKDNNARYVALATLGQAVVTEASAVQRHRATIVECLRDPDISIRRRALDLSFALIGEGTVRQLVRELLSFLEVADAEFKPAMTAKIFAAAAQYAPSRRWHIDTLVRTLQLAGAHASDEDLNGFLLLVANEPDHQAYVVRRLYVSLGSTEALAQEGLVIAALWCIGEYGELLLQAAPHGSGDDAAMAAPITSVQVVTLVRTAMKSAFANANVRQYGLTAAAKLTTRFVDTAAQTLLQRLVAEYATSIDVELQQRAVEFAKLGTTEFVGLRAGLLERMPAPEYKGPDQVASILNPAARARAHLPRNTADADAVEVPSAKPGAAASTAAARSDMDLLIDLMSDDAAPPSTPAAPASGSSPSSGGGSGGGQTSINSLLDLLGGASISSSSAAAAAAGSPPAAASASVAEKSIYSKHGLSVTLRKLSTSSADQASITAVFQNTGDSFLSDILLQVAVPRSMKLQLHPATANALPAGSGTASQGMSISHPPNAAIRLRIKLAFSVDGQTHDELINFDGF